MTPPTRPDAAPVIESAGPSAAPVIARLSEIVDRDPWSERAVAGILALPRAFGLIARQGDEPLGFLLAQAAAQEAEIINLAVAPTARRRGIGSALLDAAIGRARGCGAHAMFLEVARDNLAARALYEGRGFVQVGIRNKYYRVGPINYIDAIILRRDLVTTPGAPTL